MAKTSLNFIVPIEIFDTEVMVSIGETDEQLFGRLKRYGVSPYEWPGLRFSEQEVGKYTMFETGAAILRIRHSYTTPDNLAIISHEILHAVIHIMERIGVKLGLGTSEEVYTYTAQFLTKKIYAKMFS